MIYVLILFLIGVILGNLFPVTISPAASRYLSISLLAGLDSILGGARAYLQHQFDERVFFSGFFVNTVMAAFLVFFGDKMNVDLYLAAVVAFGVRLFQNLAIVRRILIVPKMKKP